MLACRFEFGDIALSAILKGKLRRVPGVVSD